MKSLKYIGIGILLALGVTVMAAPSTQFFVNIAPFITDTYLNGTTALEWLNFYTKYASTSAITVSSLGGTGTRCVQTDNNGFLTKAATSCSSGGGGGSDVNWTFFNNSGIQVSTTTNQVLIGDTATSSLANLEVSFQTAAKGSLLTLGSTTLQNFTARNSTSTNATSTNFFSTTASSSNLFTALFNGANLATCNASTGKITWAAGLFACGTDNTSSSTLLSDNNAWSGGNIFTNATSTNFFSTTASTTNQFGQLINGFGLSTCTGTNALTWSGGSFSCTAQPQGTVTSVSGTSNRITSTGGATPVIDISGSYVGQSSITTLGTITTGIWNAGAVTSSGLGTFANLLVTGSSTLQNFTALNSTTTNATSTSLSTTNASSTNFWLSSAGGTAGCATFSVAGLLSNTGVACGTGGGGSNTDKFATSTNGLTIYPNAGATTALVVGESATTTASLFEVNGRATVGNIVATTTGFANRSQFQEFTGTNSTTTNATTTTTFSGTASSTSLFSTTGNIGTLTLGAPLTVPNGGTGAVTLTGCLTGNGTGAITGSGTCTNSATTITIAGTANQIASSAGAQDLSTNRTWTLSLTGPYTPATYTTNGVLYGAGTGSIAATAQGGSNTVLVANAGAPSFSAAITVGTSVTTPLFIGSTGGSVTAPIYSFSGDSNNGLWSSAADTLNFSTNGLERARITSNGILDVGTTTDGGLAQENISSTTGAQLGLFSGAGYAGIIFHNNEGVLNISSSTVAGTATGTSPALTLDPSKNPSIGVSTSTLFATLAINSQGNFSNNAMDIATPGGVAFLVKDGGLSGYSTTSPYALSSVEMDNTNLSFAVSNQGSSTPSLAVENVNNNGTVLIATSSNVVNRLGVLASAGKVYMSGLTASAGLQTGVMCLDGNNQLINDSVACLASAQRFKTEITPLTVGLDEVMKLQPVSFLWKKDFNEGYQNDPNKNGVQYSLIADQVQKVDPNLVSVTTATTTFEGITYAPKTVEGLADTNHWVSLFVATFHDIETQIQTILSKLTGDEAKINAQQKEIDELQAAVKSLQAKK